MIFTADPLLLGGELLVIGCTPDGRLLCEAVYYDVEHEDDPPPRVILHPRQVLPAGEWARQAA